MEEEDVLAANLVTDLAHGFQERQRFDIANGATDLGDHHINVRATHRQDSRFDLVGDVRNHLHGVSEVLAATLLCDDAGVDLTGRHVRLGRQIVVEEPFVVSNVEVSLGPVVSDEDLAVLKRVHGSRINVEVRVQLLHRDAQSATDEEVPEAGCRQTLTERRGNSTSDKDMFRLCLAHGLPGYQPNFDLRASLTRGVA